MSAKPKTAAPRRARKAPAKSSQKSGGTPGPTGNLTKQERDPLLLQAKDAFNIQSQRGRVEPGMSFDEWRRDMVMDRTGLAGISKINRSHWRDVMALFLELSGREDEAFTLLNKTGIKTYRPTGATDTWETCETYVALIHQALADHAKALIVPWRYIQAGWILAAARQRTGKPTLTMATLAERLDPKTLQGLLSHLLNHIAVREGRAMPERRAKRRYPKAADPGEMADPF